MKFERIGNICRVRNGYAFKSEQFVDAGVPIIRISDINSNAVKSKNAVRIKYNPVFENFKIINGDLLIAMSGATTGKYGIYNSDEVAFQNQRVGCFVIKDEEKLSRQYLLQALRFLKPVIERKAHGSGQPNISGTNIEDLEIPLPSLSDQIQIANILSKAETLIEQRKQSIALLDELLKSSFLEMFGDPSKNNKGFPFTELENFCSVIVDCPHSTPVKSDIETNYPCIRTSELTDGYISWDSMQYLDETEYKKRTLRLIPQAGDIVYGREGTYGEAIRIPATHKFSLGQRTMLFRPDLKKTNSIFLWAMVRSDFVYRQATKKNSGSTVGHVNVKDIKQFQILNPPIELQIQFAQLVEKTEALKEQYKNSLQELKNLYGSLSQRAFKGELNFPTKTS